MEPGTDREQMMAKVMSITTRYTAGMFPRPFQAAELDCGHWDRAEGRFTLGTTDRLPDLVVGDDHECVSCAQREAALASGRERIPALLARSTYTRHRGRSILFYGRDEHSPTGVRLVGQVPAELHDEVCAQARAMKSAGKTPLSPTERP